MNVSWYERPLIGNEVIDRDGHVWEVTARTHDSAERVVSCTLTRTKVRPYEAKVDPPKQSDHDVARESLRELAANGSPQDRIHAAQVLLTLTDRGDD